MNACPPTKTKFPSRRAARRAARAILHPLGRMHAYRCGGHWHIGHRDRIDRGAAKRVDQ